MDLVITEKDVVARDCCTALTGRKPHGGWPFEAGGYSFMPLQGHLLEQVEPEEVNPAWADRHDMSQLPIRVGASWPKHPSGKRAAERVSALAKALKDCDGRVYCAGDADDEGQLIVDEVLEHLGYDPSDSRFWRVFVNDNLAANIRQAFDRAEPNAEHVGAGRGALARQLGDFAFGINESRLATHETAERADVGRVQTPTLGLVVARDAAIESHVASEYHSLKVSVRTSNGAVLPFELKPGEGMCDDGKRVLDRSRMEAARQTLLEQGVPATVEVKVQRKRKEPPKPFNMTTLAAHSAAGESKLTAQQTMEVSQRLRDVYHAITYNRSASEYLNVEHFHAAPATCSKVLATLGAEMPLDFERMRPTFDDSKVQGHHGIIPQAIELDLSLMEPAERSMYTAIAERYLAQFLPAIEYDHATASFTVEGIDGTLELSAKSIADAGYAAHVLKSDASKVSGERIDAGGHRTLPLEPDDAEVSSHETAPPKRYTDGTLMVDMARAARFVRDKELRDALLAKDEGNPGEHGSIGTPATRASIIEALVEKGYLERRKGALASTPQGRALFSIVPADAKGIDLTARWHLMQVEVAAGRAEVDCIARDAEGICKQHKESGAYSGKSLSPRIGQCPRCGEGVISKGRSFTCSTNRYVKSGNEWELARGCGFSMPAVIRGTRITERQAKSLLEGKPVTLKRKGGAVTLRVTDGELEVRSMGPARAKGPGKAQYGRPKSKGMR